VVRHSAANHGPDESPRLVVDIDNQLARDKSVAKGYNPSPFLEPDIRDESWRQAPMQCAHVPKRVPDGRGICSDLYLAINGGHDSVAPQVPNMFL
jgi:hypothetical protein